MLSLLFLFKNMRIFSFNIDISEYLPFMVLGISSFIFRNFLKSLLSGTGVIYFMNPGSSLNPNESNDPFGLAGVANPLVKPEHLTGYTTEAGASSFSRYFSDTNSTKYFYNMHLGGKYREALTTITRYEGYMCQKPINAVESNRYNQTKENARHLAHAIKYINENKPNDSFIG